MKQGLLDALDIIKVLNHPVRLETLCLLIEKGEMSVSDILSNISTPVSQSQLSQYLKILKEQKLVDCATKGKYVYYRITSDKVSQLIQLLHDLFCKEVP